MPTRDYPSAFAAYRAALGGLYAPPSAEPAERGAAGLAPGADLGARAQEVEDRSVELGQAAAAARASPDYEQRELAALQLLAGAAADLAVADDLSRAAGAAAAGAPERGAEGGVPAEILAILSVPPSAGLRGLPGAAAERERGVGPSDPRAARAALKEAVAAALQDIPKDAARAGQVAFVGLAEVPLPPLKEAAGLVLHDLMDRLGQGLSLLLRKAVGLVLRAVEKILAALGQDARDGLRDKVLGWIDDLKNGTLFEQLLTKLYEVPRIKAEVEGQVAGAADDTAAGAFNGASDRVTELAARFEKQRVAIEWAVRGLAWVRPWVLGLPPWGALALTGAYVGLIGYAVGAGGDYVDWYRTGDGSALDLVRGVRTVVREGLTGPPA